jgi:hypothetical protein
MPRRPPITSIAWVRAGPAGIAAKLKRVGAEAFARLGQRGTVKRLMVHKEDVILSAAFAEKFPHLRG